MTNVEEQPDGTSNQPEIQPCEDDRATINEVNQKIAEWLQRRNEKDSNKPSAYTDPRNVSRPRDPKLMPANRTDSREDPTKLESVFSALIDAEQKLDQALAGLADLIPRSNNDPMLPHKFLAIHHTAKLVRTPPKGLKGTKCYTDACHRLTNLVEDVTGTDPITAP
ncbi:hypothetical protein KC853_01475 [Candidatus Saccharibacteria bacterium]|nr:hypothetical protein [Candidatus Saccharibacteria bacterium]MCB9834783.1 hypothetical protein [Candidatus Nomurabacteria bacterium]